MKNEKMVSRLPFAAFATFVVVLCVVSFRVASDMRFASVYCEKLSQDIMVVSSRRVSKDEAPVLADLHIDRPIRRIDRESVEFTARGMQCSVILCSVSSGWEWSVRVGSPPLSTAVVSVNADGVMKSIRRPPRNRVLAAILQERY